MYINICECECACSHTATHWCTLVMARFRYSLKMRRVTAKSGCSHRSVIYGWGITFPERKQQRAHRVYRVCGEGWLCFVAFNGRPTVSSESECCQHRAHHNTDKAELDFLWLLWDRIEPSSFAAYHVLFHALQHFLIFLSGSQQWVVLYHSYFPTSLLTLSSSMSRWCFFFPLLLEFLPPCFQAENQIYKSKAMEERRGDWRAFKSFPGSQSFRGRNKQEIKMEQGMAAILLFGGTVSRCISQCFLL